MELRYRLAVVTGAGGGAGRELAVALSRAGAAVLSVDADAVAAEATAELVRAARVGSWSLQADPGQDLDLPVLTARARDLGGADLLVDTVADADPDRLAGVLVDGLADRRGSREGTPAVVLVRVLRIEPPHAEGARAMVVAVGRRPAYAEACRAVLRLLRDGLDGQVVELTP